MDTSNSSDFEEEQTTDMRWAVVPLNRQYVCRLAVHIPLKMLEACGKINIKNDHAIQKIYANNPKVLELYQKYNIPILYHTTYPTRSYGINPDAFRIRYDFYAERCIFNRNGVDIENSQERIQTARKYIIDKIEHNEGIPFGLVEYTVEPIKGADLRAGDETQKIPAADAYIEHILEVFLSVDELDEAMNREKSEKEAEKGKEKEEDPEKAEEKENPDI